MRRDLLGLCPPLSRLMSPRSCKRQRWCFALVQTAPPSQLVLLCYPDSSSGSVWTGCLDRHFFLFLNAHGCHFCSVSDCLRSPQPNHTNNEDKRGLMMLYILATWMFEVCSFPTSLTPVEQNHPVFWPSNFSYPVVGTSACIFGRMNNLSIYYLVFIQSQHYIRQWLTFSSYQQT